jgi:phosphoglycerate dehydrogenase-like enzyme
LTKIAVASPSFCEHPKLRAELLARYPDAKLNPDLRVLAGQELIAFLAGADVAVVALEHMTADIIDALPDLKVISKLGTGVDALDAGAMARRGIRLGWRPGANATSVAELVISLALIGLKRIGPLRDAAAQGRAVGVRMGRLLSGRVFGIHGCGHIGQAVARFLKSFDCEILAHDAVDRSDFYRQHDIKAVCFDELVNRSEVLSIHVALTEQTAGLYDGRLLGRLRPDCVLINTARGEVWDEAALKAHLRANSRFMACADVFVNEIQFDFELLNMPNFYGTPHIGGSAEEARYAMGRIAIEGIEDNFVPVPGQRPFAGPAAAS